MLKPSPISKMRYRQRCVKLACLYNLPRRLFLTIWMQSQSTSLPTALWRSTSVVLQPYHSCRRARGFKTQQSDGLSLTPSRLSVSHSASLPILLLFLQICSMHLHLLVLHFFFPALWLSSPLTPLPLLLLPCPLDLWVLTHSLPSSSPVCHQGWIHPLIFFFSFSPGCHHPSLLLFQLTLPICLFTFQQTRVFLYYSKPCLSSAHVELTQKHNVRMLERNTDFEAM